MANILFKLKISPNDANVLIIDENGTGKELVSQAIHQQCHRPGNPFVKVDVVALTELLFESEFLATRKERLWMPQRIGRAGSRLPTMELIFG